MQLEQNSKQIAQEKQDYIDKLNVAASKLESELEKKQVSRSYSYYKYYGLVWMMLLRFINNKHWAYNIIYI